jgi:LPPG:FO 2-phospho-L-lactate transferase
VAALAGGVGGAKLAEGLQAHLGSRLTVVVNTGDDVERHGLLVMPDHDTVMYTLAGLENAESGWGLADESWRASEQLGRYGEETWFRLGDRDLAAHLVRTARLRRGDRLTTICLDLQQALGVTARILPMSDDPVRTEVRTDAAWLEFQDYFVRLRQEPTVLGVRFRGAADARPTREVLDALTSSDAIVICPSNPVVSIGPILAVPGLRAGILAARRRGVPVAALSPIVGGRALKGPADRMLASLGHESSALGVARLYADLVDVMTIDQLDSEQAPEIEALGLRVVVVDSIMTDDASRARLAGVVLGALGVR